MIALQSLLCQKGAIGCRKQLTVKISRGTAASPSSPCTKGEAASNCTSQGDFATLALQKFAGGNGGATAKCEIHADRYLFLLRGCSFSLSRAVRASPLRQAQVLQAPTERSSTRSARRTSTSGCTSWPHGRRSGENDTLGCNESALLSRDRDKEDVSHPVRRARHP